MKLSRTLHVSSFYTGLMLLFLPFVSCGQKENSSAASEKYSRFYVTPETIDSMLSARGFIGMNEGRMLPDITTNGKIAKMSLYRQTDDTLSEENEPDYIVTYHHGMIESYSDYNGLQYHFVYDSNDRLVQQVHYYKSLTTNDSILIYTDFNYDKYGNLLDEFKYDIPLKGGPAKFKSYKKYDYYLDNDIVVAYCRGIDSFYQTIGRDERFEIEYKIANGKLLSETGKKPRYQKKYTYNKDLLLSRYEGIFADGKQNHAYYLDAQNRLIRYIDSFVFSPGKFHLFEEHRIKYGNRTKEINFYENPNNYYMKTGSDKPDYDTELKLVKKHKFENELLVEETIPGNYTEKHSHVLDSKGNWILIKTNISWFDKGKLLETRKFFTRRRIEYPVDESVPRQPVLLPDTEKLKNRILDKYKDFLNAPIERP
jgi:hypothetical protein